MKHFWSDLKKIRWEKIIKTDETNVETSFEKFYTAINNLLNLHAPYIKVSAKDLKLQQKPWITKGILNAIQKKNKIQKKFLRTKDKEQKEIYHKIFKRYRNQINKLCRISKSQYYHNYFT